MNVPPAPSDPKRSETLRHAVVETDLNGRITAWSPGAERLFGWPASQTSAQDGIQLLFPDGSRSAYDEFYSRVDAADAAAMQEKVRLATSLSEPSTWEVEYRFHRTDGQVRWFSSIAGTLFDDHSARPTRIVGLVTDITDKKRAETAQRFLSEASRILASSLDYEEILDRVVNVAVPSQADMCGVYLVQPDGSLRRVALAHRDPARLEILLEAKRHFPLPHTQVLRRVFTTGEPVLIPEVTEKSIRDLVRNRQQVQFVKELQPLSVITVPLIAHGAILGALTLLTEKGGRVYDTYDLGTAAELGRRCGMAVDNARLYRKLAENERHLALALQVSSLGFLEYRRDLAGGYYASERWAQIFGLTVDELPSGDEIEAWYRSQVHPDDLGILLQKAREFQPGVAQTHTVEIRVRHKKDGWVWVRVINYVKDRDAAGLVTDGIRVIMDVTDVKQAERTLKAHNEELERRIRKRTSELERLTNRLRRLALELTVAEQNERRRLAEFLHDDLQQLLMAARWQANMTPVDEANAKAAATRDLTVWLLDQAIAGSRTLTAQLRPPALYESGLAASLEWLTEWMQKAHGLNVGLEIDAGLRPIVDMEAALLFDSVRELLLNVVKHAEVESATVSLKRAAKGWLQLSVSDQGKGFDPGSIDKPCEGLGGLGLFSLGERLSILGGTFEVRSKPGQGTTVELLWPIAGTVKIERESAATSNGHSQKSRAHTRHRTNACTDSG